MRLNDYLIINNKKVATKIALSFEEKQQGLMNNYQKLVMSFPYETSDIRKFWMKNTPCPLDLVFCNQNKVLTVCQGVPYSLDRIGPEVPVDLIIEMPLNMAKTLNINAGSNIKLCYSIFTLAKQYLLKY